MPPPPALTAVRLLSLEFLCFSTLREQIGAILNGNALSPFWPSPLDHEFLDRGGCVCVNLCPHQAWHVASVHKIYAELNSQRGGGWGELLFQEGFSGGSVVKNPPAVAGDTD